MTTASAHISPDPDRKDDEPVAVTGAITRLLRSLPLPEGPRARAEWFAQKAGLLDAIASAAACPSLAVEARCLAREAWDAARSYQHAAFVAELTASLTTAWMTDQSPEAQS